MSTADFDPYRRWLGIPPEEQPPNHYRLLGIGLFETDPEVIQDCADRQMSHVRTHQSGPHSKISQQVLNQISLARICLLNPQKKSAYDAELKSLLAQSAPPPPPPPPVQMAPPQQYGGGYAAPPPGFAPAPMMHGAPGTAPGFAPGFGHGMQPGMMQPGMVQPGMQPGPMMHPGMQGGAMMQPGAMMHPGMMQAPMQQPAMVQPVQPQPKPNRPPVRSGGIAEAQLVSDSPAPSFGPAITTEAGSSGQSVSDRYRKPPKPAWFYPAVGLGAVVGIAVVVMLLSSIGTSTTPRKIAGEGSGEKAVPRGGSGTKLGPRIPQSIPEGQPVTTTRTGRPIRPAPATTKDKLELLDLIDTAQHGVRGDWTFVGGSLLSPADGVSRLRVPFTPPEEYQLSLIADRKEGENNLNIVLCSGEVQFAVLLDARGGRISGLHLVDDKTVMGNPTTYNGKVFDNKEPVPLMITVRKSGVKVVCDGKPIIDFKGKLSRLSMDTSSGETLDKHHLYIGAHDSNYLISRLELTPLEPSVETEPEPEPMPETEPVAAAASAEQRSLADLVQRKKKPNGVVVRGPRAAIPDEAARKAATVTIKEEIFKDKFQSAKKATEKTALGKQMLEQAKLTKTDPAGQFVLFELAAQMAGEGGDFQTAWQAIDDQAEIFDTRPIGLKQKALELVTKQAKLPGDFKFMSELAIYLVNEAVRDDEFDVALGLADDAIASSRKSKDLSVLAWLQDRSQALKEVRDAFNKRKAARDKLLTDPGDAEANEQWGEFLCLYKHDWDTGLPIWAKGSGTRAVFAKRDLTSPEDDAARLTLADDWWSVGEGEKGLPELSLKLRAAYWYRRIQLPPAPNIRNRIDDRLAQASVLELGVKKNEWIDLLRLVDVAKHRVQGSWTREGADVALRGSFADDRFYLPVAPQGSYDLQIKFSRSMGSEPFHVLVPIAQGNCLLSVGTSAGRYSRIEGGGVVSDVKQGNFGNNLLHQIDIHVDASGDVARILVEFNNIPLLKWAGPKSSLTPNVRHTLPRPGAIGIATGGGNGIGIHGARLKLNSGTILSLIDTGM